MKSKVKAIAKSEIALSIGNDELKDDGISVIYDVVGARLKNMSLEESDSEYRQPTVQEWRTITRVNLSVRRAKKNDQSAYERNGIIEWMHKMLKRLFSYFLLLKSSFHFILHFYLLFFQGLISAL